MSQIKAQWFFIAGITIGLIILVLMQTVLLPEGTSLFNSAAVGLNLEPTKYYEEYPEARVTSGPYHSIFSTVTIQCDNYSSLEKAILLVNGEEVGDFRDKQITIKVSPGDIISIDGSFYIHELVFKVVAVSENVGQPEIGQIIFVQGDISMVGEVRMK